MQPHLRKCFEAVHAVTMQGAECEMSEMISPEKEKVTFMEPIYPRGSVEVWMGTIETMMRRSVRHVTELALKDYLERPRGEFVISQSLPVIVIACTASKHLRRCGCTAFGSFVWLRMEMSSSFERK